MDQIGSGATDRRDLLARYKRLVEEEFGGLSAWEFCLPLQIVADQKEETVIEAEAFAIAAFTRAIVERIAELDDGGPGSVKLAVRKAFSEVTIGDLFSALDRLTAERSDQTPLSNETSLPNARAATGEP